MTGIPAVAALALLGACAGAGPGAGDSSTSDDAPAPAGDTCPDPVEGFDRLTPSALDRGIDGPRSPSSDAEPYECNQIPGGLVATDMDADGDIDLLFLARTGFPALYENDGTGLFAPRSVGLDVEGAWGRRVLAVTAADLDGDALPEVLVSASGLVLVSRNLGGLEFAPWEVVFHQEGYPRTCINTMALGDLDGDHDLDLVLPGLDQPDDASFQPPPDGSAPTPERLLLNQDGRFSAPTTLDRGEHEGMSVLAAFTDRDSDGDLDLWLTSDRPMGDHPPSAFFRNDGIDADGHPILADDAADIGMDARISGMGLASWDLNRDGTLDYCTGDVGVALRCYVSDGAGGWYDAGRSLGLHSEVAELLIEHPDDAGLWSPWSLEAPDLDNDGDVDLIAVAGKPPDYGSIAHSTLPSPQPDAVWERVDGDFVERTLDFADGAFAEPEEHYASAVADLDRDGYPELIVHGYKERPHVWDNPCGDGAWLTVDLAGAGDNAEGFGARVEVETGDRVRVQELHALRTLGQGPSELYFGLGEVEVIDRLTVHWPDGAVSEATEVGVRQRVVMPHPAR